MLPRCRRHTAAHMLLQIWTVLQAHYKQCYEHSLLCHRKMLWLLNPAAINMSIVADPEMAAATSSSRTVDIQVAVVTSMSDFVDARGQCGIPEMEFWFPPTSMSSTSTAPTTFTPVIYYELFRVEPIA